MREKRTVDALATREAMRQLRGWWPALVLIAGGMLLHVPSLRWGFLWDDFAHQAVFRYGAIIPRISRLNLYDYGVGSRAAVALGDLGLHPWWTSEDFRVRFFRPVTSLSLLSDYVIYRDWAPGYHVTNILLFGVLLALGYVFYRRLGVSPAAALWGLAFLALEDIHVVPVGWIANRNTVLANLFVVATLLSVDSYCRRRRPWALAGAVACFLLACGAKETALVTVALVGLYVWLLDAPCGTETLGRSCWRVLHSPVLWVFVGTAALYAGVYVATGHGTNSTLYATPWHGLGAFASRAAPFLILAGGSLFFGVSIDLEFMKPWLATPMAWALLGPVSALIWVMWKRLGHVRAARYAAGWMLIALAPAIGVTTSDRFLMDATLGSALLLGMLVDDLRTGPLRGAGRAALIVLLVACGPVLSPAMTWIRGNMFYHMAATDRETIRRADISRDPHAPRQVFVLNPPSSILALTLLPTWTVLHDDPGVSVQTLQMARRAWSWRREGAAAFVMSYGPPPLLGQRYERLFRATTVPPAPGSVFETAAFTATVLSVDTDGIRQTRLEFRHDLTDASYCFLLWRDGALRRTEPPPAGEAAAYEAAEPRQGFVP
jgi:hypothetical protein